jgi:hypothetical protein
MALGNSSDGGSLWVFLFPFALLFYALIRQFLHWWKARKWDLVTGQLEHVAFARFYAENTRGPRNQKVGAKIDYSFTFESERYGGYVGVVGFSSEEEIDKYAKALPVRTPVFVRYDKAHPDSSEVRLSDNPRLIVNGIHEVHKEPDAEIIELMPK